MMQHEPLKRIFGNRSSWVPFRSGTRNKEEGDEVAGMIAKAAEDWGVSVTPLVEELAKDTYLNEGWIDWTSGVNNIDLLTEIIAKRARDLRDAANGDAAAALDSISEYARGN